MLGRHSLIPSLTFFSLISHFWWEDRTDILCFPAHRCLFVPFSCMAFYFWYGGMHFCFCFFAFAFCCAGTFWHFWHISLRAQHFWRGRQKNLSISRWGGLSKHVLGVLLSGVLLHLFLFYPLLSLSLLLSSPFLSHYSIFIIYLYTIYRCGVDGMSLSQ